MTHLSCDPASALFPRDAIPTSITPVHVVSSFENITSYIASAVIETGFYGLHLILGPLTLYTLLRKPEQSSLSSSTFIDKIVVIVCGVQFCATTAVRLRDSDIGLILTWCKALGSEFRSCNFFVAEQLTVRCCGIGRLCGRT